MRNRVFKPFLSYEQIDCNYCSWFSQRLPCALLGLLNLDLDWEHFEVFCNFDRFGTEADRVSVLTPESYDQMPVATVLESRIDGSTDKGFVFSSGRAENCLHLRPNVRAKRATTAGRQARAGENVPRTA